jgi:hypothetical protein
MVKNFHITHLDKEAFVNLAWIEYGADYRIPDLT